MRLKNVALKAKHGWNFTKEIYNEWNDDNCFRLSAALSYYTIFSLAPILLIVITIAGAVFGQEAVTGQIYSQIKGLIGAEGALGVQNMVENAYKQKQGWIPQAIGIGTLILSATATFTVLQDSLNFIWDVEAKPERGWLRFILTRVLSFALVMGIGFLLMVSLVINAILVALHGFIARLLDDWSVYIVEGIQLVISFGVITLLFAMMFKFLPDVKLRWRDVWRASMVTSLLFGIGRYLIGFYLGQSNLSNSYGAAASVIIIMLWVNYSALIFFFGAEFIFVDMKHRGLTIMPTKGAVRVVKKQVEVEDPHKAAKMDDKPLTSH